MIVYGYYLVIRGVVGMVRIFRIVIRLFVIVLSLVFGRVWCEGKEAFKFWGSWRCWFVFIYLFSKVRDVMFSTWKRKVINNFLEIAFLVNLEN